MKVEVRRNWIYKAFFIKIIIIMDFKTRFYGGYGVRPSTILELTINADSATIKEDILEFKSGKVSDQLIEDLKYLLDEIENHNQEVDEYNKINE